MPVIAKRSTTPLFSIVLLALVGCGGAKTETTTPPGTSPQADACTDLSTKARARLDTALQAQVSCAMDNECTNVAYGASCFDSCSRALAKSGEPAFSAAKADANANECTSFKDHGCSFLAPPCAPPMPAHCVNHQCQ